MGFSGGDAGDTGAAESVREIDAIGPDLHRSEVQ
jgi:hypothetical protein